MIVFYGCDAGHSQPFLQALANQLRVIVRSFAGGIPWTLSAEGKSPHRIIVRRGIKWKELPKAITCTPQVADKSGKPLAHSGRQFGPPGRSQRRRGAGVFSSRWRGASSPFPGAPAAPFVASSSRTLDPLAL